MISLTRRYRFCASHRLNNVTLSKAENARIYGKCNNAYGHGHDYTLEVTVAGDLDPVAGLMFPISHLDRLVEDCILARFDHRNLNVDVDELKNVIPTTENMALVIAQLLTEVWNEYITTAAQPIRVHLQETDRNSFEVRLPVAAASRTVPAGIEESVLVNV